MKWRRVFYREKEQEMKKEKFLMDFYALIERAEGVAVISALVININYLPK